MAECGAIVTQRGNGDKPEAEWQAGSRQGWQRRVGEGGNGGVEWEG